MNSSQALSHNPINAGYRLPTARLGVISVSARPGLFISNHFERS